MMGLKHQAAAARKWRSIAQKVERHFPSHLPPLLFLTDPERTPAPVETVGGLPEGCGVIYRHFGASHRSDMAEALREACTAIKAKLLIAADPELAKSVGADGVHWPEARLSEAEPWQGQFEIQTASAHSESAVRAASRAKIDAALVSSVFASRSASAKAPIGPEGLREIRDASDVPIYALGGITLENAQQVADFAGIAAIDAFLTR